jgi:hypothetical protein
MVVSDGSTMVEHLPHFLKVEDSNPATTASTEVLENGKVLKKIQNVWLVVVTEW